MSPVIPKVEVLERVTHYRSIDCCNVYNKKIMTNRLNSVLYKIISSLQSVFVQGRSIHDNVLIADEILYSFQDGTKTKSMVTKLDTKKTFDRLEWKFITKCFRELGFCDQGM